MHWMDTSLILSVCILYCACECVRSINFSTIILMMIADAQALMRSLQTRPIPFWSFNSCSGSNHWWWLLFIHIYMCTNKKRINRFNTWLFGCCCCFDCFFCTFWFFSLLLNWISKCGECLVFVKKKKYQNWLLSHYLYPIAHCLLFTFYLLSTLSTLAYILYKKLLLKVSKRRWDRWVHSHSQNIRVIASTHTQPLKT